MILNSNITSRNISTCYLVTNKVAIDFMFISLMKDRVKVTWASAWLSQYIFIRKETSKLILESNVLNHVSSYDVWAIADILSTISQPLYFLFFHWLDCLLQKYTLASSWPSIKRLANPICVREAANLKMAILIIKKPTVKGSLHITKGT